MENLVIVVVLLIVVGLAGLYVYKAKKNGKKCIGCPENCSCCDKQGGCCGDDN